MSNFIPPDLAKRYLIAKPCGMTRDSSIFSCLFDAHEAINDLHYAESFDARCAAIRRSCSDNLADLADDAPRLNFFLSGIQLIADRLPDDPGSLPAVTELMEAWRLAERHFGKSRYHPSLPKAYPEYTRPGFRRQCKEHLAKIERAALHADLKGSLCSLLLDAAAAAINLSGQQFNFLLQFNNAFSQPGLCGTLTEPIIKNLLISLGYNDITFLAWHHEYLFSRLSALPAGNRLAAVTDLLDELRAIPVRLSEACYPHLPPVASYAKHLLEEEFRAAMISLSVNNAQKTTEKIGVNLSVAEIACLLKLLQGEDVFRAENTREVLRFAVAAFRSKRQGNFSFRNLSKEYYGVSQSTAASIKGLLQQMLCSVNRSFFPVVFALILTGR